MKNLLLIFKGFLVGIANIIPGVSGGTMAIIVGIYEKLIDTIGHLFTKLKENFFFLMFLGIGFILSILLGSKAIKYALNNFLLFTVLLFAGLVAGGIPLLYKQIKNKKSISNIICAIITFSLVIVITFINPSSINDFQTITPEAIIILILLGFISAGCMIIPGISGSLVLMILGYYDFILGIISNITKMDLLGYNLTILGLFLVGCVIGVFFFAILIGYCLKKFKDQTSSAIFGFVLASVFSLFYQNLSDYQATIDWKFFLELALGIIFLAGAFYLTYHLSKIEKPEELEIEEK